MKPAPLKATIQFEYGKIVQLTDANGVAWQRDHICKPIFDPIAAEYPSMEGYLDEADLGLGCGFPVALAAVKPGETVLDLGCAAGVDSFIAREATGSNGRVIGLDLTPELVERASKIAASHGYSNISFHCADIEHLPIEDQSVDVIISNGVFSLLTDRARVFREMHRVLRPGGRFCVFDLVRKEEIPEKLIAQVLQFTGCLNGIFHMDAYLEDIRNAGFTGISIGSERNIPVPTTDSSQTPHDYLGLYAIGFTGLRPHLTGI